MSVPSKYDLTISDGSDTYGYVLYRAWSGGESSNAPQKAIHSYTPTFVPRTNIQGNYGDDTEDFFLTFSQKDWSLGEQQKTTRATNEVASRRYWQGENVDIAEAGEVTLTPQVRSIDVGTEDIFAVVGFRNTVFAYGDTNLWEIEADGTATSVTSHGFTLVNFVARGIAADSTEVYLTDTNTISSWDGATFSSFSASGASTLCYHNNTLFGIDGGALYSWSTTGTRSSALFTWQDIDGGAINFDLSTHFRAVMASYGGKLFISLGTIGGFAGSGWIYDGVGVSKIFEYPPSFIPNDIAIVNGMIVVSGQLNEGVRGNRPALYYYNNGATGFLWRSSTAESGDQLVALAALGESAFFTDPIRGKIMRYRPDVGGVSTVGAFTHDATARTMMAAGEDFLILVQDDDIAFQYPHDTSISTTGTVTSALIDFDSSLTKLFRGIKVDYIEGSDGDGGSVDIAYRTNDVAGAFTTLQSGLTAGQEYSVGSVGTPITGRSIAYKVTLNKGTSTNGPTLKRVYVRSAPQVTQRHRGLYHIDCTTPNSQDQTTEDNSGSPIPRSGMDMVHELREFADAGTLLTITDPLHSFTGIIELLDIAQVHSGDDPGYVVTLAAREV